jgi:hypothetical protein
VLLQAMMFVGREPVDVRAARVRCGATYALDLGRRHRRLVSEADDTTLPVELTAWPRR